MAGRSREVTQALNRREFLTRASIVVVGAAALATIAKNMSLTPLNKTSGQGQSTGSMFTPKAGSQLKSWAGKLAQFRLR